ncbi:MAG: hypothetical protein AAF513_08895 [Pseudomonadota bacterium]
MGAIGYYLERAGIMTTGISLVRENTAALQPPRALWVPFPLGRPLGAPAQSEFQHRVIAAALDLLSAPRGPVMADFPEDAPGGEAGARVQACPVSFALADSSDVGWVSRLRSEVAQLADWYDLGQRRRGRTTFGLSGEQMEALVDYLGGLLDAPEGEVDLRRFKFALEDARTFYTEALTAQPGEHDPERVAQWVYGESELGRAIVALYQRFAGREETAQFARIVAPRQALGYSTGDEQLHTGSRDE